MSEASPHKGKSSSGWIRIILFLSLAANLLVVGLVAGAVLRHDRDGWADRHRPNLRELGYGPYGQALSQADRREISRAMNNRSGDLKANRAAFRKQVTTLLDALRARPFDPELVQSVIVNQQEKLFERQEIGRQLLLDRIKAMDNRERAAFADRLERSLRRGPGANRARP